MDVDGPHDDDEPRSTAGPAKALRELARQLHHARQEGSNDDSSEHGDTQNSTAEVLGQALHHFARVRQHARRLAGEARVSRLAVQETRTRMDAAFLAQQNRNYEVGYLYREIEKCSDYDSIYQELPLVDEQEWLQLRRESDEEQDQGEPPEGEHERMVARLRLEVAQRQRAQAELKALLASKTKVIKETELRKSSLEQLETQLDEFIASAKAIQDKFSTM